MKKRLSLALLFTLALAVGAVLSPTTLTPARGQDSTTTARRVNPRASAPATCAADRGEVYFNTADDKLYRCTAANTWTEVGGGGLSGLTAGQYLKATSATAATTDGVKRYVATLTQTGTAAPVATVRENSLGGTLVWARLVDGYYTATLAGAFPAGTWAMVSGERGGEPALYSLKRSSDNAMLLRNLSELDENEVAVEIRVYP